VKHGVVRIDLLSGGENVPNGPCAVTFPLDGAGPKKNAHFEDGVLTVRA
jgi:hypothetical protein